jgi:hypothetical protein
VLRLEDEVVVSRWFETRHGPASHPSASTMLDYSAKIRLPSTKVIGHINDRHAGPARTLFFEATKITRHVLSGLQHRVRLGKFEAVDHVDQEEGDRGFVRCAAV